MTSTDKIIYPIKAEMQNFEGYFRNILKSKVPLLDIITNFILRRKGKQMRPMFVFLSAKLNGEITEATYTAATFIELLHTATLVHDDVVDESFERRGFFSINSLWKSKIAVLVGDFMLSKGLLLAVEKNEFALLRIVSEAVRDMSEGELLQLEKSRSLNITEDIYYEVIRKKTAVLIASCAAIGAKSVHVDDNTLEMMRLFGEKVGMAFQIKDDLFDYEKTNLIGKPVGNDIQEKKMTLPLIYTLEQVSKSEKRRLLNIVKNHNKDTKKVNELMQIVANNGGLEYTAKKMLEFKGEALQILSQFPDNEAKESLRLLVEYTVERNK